MNHSLWQKDFSKARPADSGRRLRQHGFSLIELLLVVACIGIVASIAFPSVEKARKHARSTAAVSNLREMISSELEYRLQNRRFARLDELNTFRNGQLGTLTGTTLKKGSFTYQMSPVTPTDSFLEAYFVILATEVYSDGTVVQYMGDEEGKIVKLSPLP